MGSALMKETVLLDLFCCDGGAALGYHLAGFQVIGIDIAPHRVYPFDYIQADALDILRDEKVIHLVDAIHASPPCQAYSPLNAYNKVEYPDLIEPVRELLITTGKPYIIENVVQAPLRDPAILCGSMFDMRVYRHRSFETNWPLTTPEHPPHVNRCTRNGYLPTPQAPNMSIHGGRHSRAWLKAAADVLDVDWMVTNDTRASIRAVCEAIPPRYTHHIGKQLIASMSD
jgi:DNA (cytosine-5)-methyltransferase 1